jgi:hypothetical protein
VRGGEKSTQRKEASKVNVLLMQWFVSSFLSVTAIEPLRRLLCMQSMNKIRRDIHPNSVTFNMDSYTIVRSNGANIAKWMNS